MRTKINIGRLLLWNENPDKGQIENLDAGVGYSDYIDQGIENPYEDGWD